MFPTELRLELNKEGDKLHCSWQSDIGTNGTASLAKSKADESSEIHVLEDIKDWPQFREYALSLEYRRYIFRGQDICKRLRTSFHRSRRKDLIRYIAEDIPEALLTLTGKTTYNYRLTDPIENAAFLNLLQHHGFPTPLLDWTFSPFVAAFFAYRRRRHRDIDENKIRIYVFDKQRWEVDFPQLASITLSKPHFSILRTLSIGNDRAIPQQALLTMTNIDDIESYLHEKGVETSHRYLHAVDLPFDDRRFVMEELAAMGITAGSLFPGLDGACEELRGRFFHPRS